MSAAARVFNGVAVPLCIVAIAWEPNFAHGFINYNESGQHLAAIRELSRGALLFRDVFVQYGPLHYFVPQWATLVFGESIPTLRGYFLVGEIAGLLAVLGLCRALIPNRLFAAAAALVIAVEAHHPFWATRWGGFRFAFVYLSLWCLVGTLGGARPSLLFLAGASAALAFLHTYDAGLAAVLAAAVYFAWVAANAAHRPQLLRQLGFYALGLASCLLPFLGYLLATGTLADYWAQLPLPGSGRAWLQPIGRGVLTPTVLAPAVVYLLALGYIAREAVRRGAIDASLAALLVVMSSGLLLYGASFRAIRGPQFETSLPLAVLVLFFLMQRGFDSFRRMREDARSGPGLEPGSRVEGWLGLGFCAIAVLAIAAGEIRTYGGGPARWAAYQLEKGNLVARHFGADPLDDAYRAIDVERAGATRVPVDQAREIEEITAYLETATGPDDLVLGYPDLGIFNYFADRGHATRFVIPILAAADEEWTEEILDVVRQRRPTVVLLGNQLSTLARATRKRSEYLSELREHVRQHYSLEKRFGRLDVYRAKERPVR